MAEASVLSSGSRRPPPPPSKGPASESGISLTASRRASPVSQARERVDGGLSVQFHPPGTTPVQCSTELLDFGIKPICTATVKSIELIYSDALAPRVETWIDEDGDGFADEQSAELLPETVTVTGVSVDDPQFHVVFDESAQVSALEAVQVQVVFLPRHTSVVNATLSIETSAGPLKCSLSGKGGPNPFGLKPLVGVSLPIGLPYSPMIAVYNPNDEPLQVRLLVLCVIRPWL